MRDGGREWGGLLVTWWGANAIRGTSGEKGKTGAHVARKDASPIQKKCSS